MIALVAIALIVILAIVFSRSRLHNASAPPPPSETAAANSAATPAASTPESPAPAASAPPAASPAPASPAAATAATGAASGASGQGEPVNRVQPDVPESAMRTIHGTIAIIARVHVDASGNVTSASLEHRGPSRYFATRALDAARNWKFRSPQQNGSPVPSEWNLHFDFRRSGINIQPEQVRP